MKQKIKLGTITTISMKKDDPYHAHISLRVDNDLTKTIDFIDLDVFVELEMDEVTEPFPGLQTKKE